jgi:hypothetical protein
MKAVHKQLNHSFSYLRLFSFEFFETRKIFYLKLKNLNNTIEVKLNFNPACVRLISINFYKLIFRLSNNYAIFLLA